MDYDKAEVYSIPNTEEGKKFVLELFQKFEDEGYHISRNDSETLITLVADKKFTK